jgi:hypothetical protein
MRDLVHLAGLLHAARTATTSNELQTTLILLIEHLYQQEKQRELRR